MIDGDKITFTKQEIQEAREHYCRVADEFKPEKLDEAFDFRYPFYLGKAEVLTDILKMYESLEG